MSIELDWDRLAQGLIVTAEECNRAAAAALYERAEAIMADSRENYVPVDEGPLRSTGHVEPPEVAGTEISVRLVYGGPAAPYAVMVHESSQQQVNREIDRQLGHARHGNWKYLEQPFVEGTRTLGEDLADVIRRHLERIVDTR